uniref:Uncharacterized protein n=1 Tax=Oryza barthii TaxID=65489 RepID=A0A0D3GIJ8_9ORYZ
MQRTARWLPSHGSTSCGGDRWSRTAATTWRREDLVQRGGGRIVEGEPAAGIGGKHAMQRTARRLIRSGALMAEVQERNSGGGRRCRCGGRAIGRGGGSCGLCAD